MPRTRAKPEGYLTLSPRADLKSTAETTSDTMAIVDPMNYNRPKLKFNFTVTIKFRNPPIDFGNLIKSEDGQLTDELSFAVRQASRPNPTVIYQDINQYNYRSKVATKVDYGSMQITMYDDVENFAHTMYEVYLKSISPIANIRKEQANLLSTYKEGGGNGPKNKAFNSNGVLDGENERLGGGTGSIGPLPPGIGQESGIIENICIRHWSYALQERRGDESGEDVPQIQYVEYQFLNPKVLNMTLDELDMGQSDVNTVMMNFTYDSVFIDAPRSWERDLDFSFLKPEPQTFTINDIRGRVADIERLYRRVRRLDTIPDIPIINTISTFIPPITGNLGDIQLPKPDIDLPDILSF